MMMQERPAGGFGLLTGVFMALLVAAPWGLAAERPPYASTYETRTHPAMVIRNVSLLTGTGDAFTNVDVAFADGRITWVGGDAPVTPGASVIRGDGLWLTPGIIDVHSHLGDYPAPSLPSMRDGNEAVSPNTAQVWAEHSVWPQDPQFRWRSPAA